MHGTWKFELTAREAGVHADVDGMVDEALAASRNGNIVTRVARDLTGGEEDAQVPPRVTYSRAAVRRLVERVKAKVDRPARDAKVDFPSLDRVKEQHGFKVNAASLEQRVEQALSVPGVDRRVAAPVDRIQPKVTRAQLAKRLPGAPRGRPRPTSSCGSTRSCTWSSRTPWPSAPWASTPPPGMYHIQNKAVDPAWTSRTATGRAIWPDGRSRAACRTTRSRRAGSGIFDGAGIHGTDETYSLGHAASHGCIRMAIPDVIELYDQVPVGAPDLHRLRGVRRSRRSAPPPSLVPPEGLAPGVSNAERADEYPTLPLRSTAYHIVEASLGPWIGCQGGPACSCSSTRPASAS